MKIVKKLKILPTLEQVLVTPVIHKIYSEKLLSHQLIFCINSGRAGSNYLAELLGTTEEIISYHEPDPAMNGSYLSLINQYDYNYSFKKRRIKSQSIKNILLKLPKDKIYCETNHMFIKTFFDVVIHDFKNIEVIILRRRLASVLKSFIELGYFSSKNPNWSGWMSSPNAVTSAISCIASDQNLDQYDLCIAYLIDIEARAIRFQKTYSWLKIHEVRLESLIEFSNIQELCKQLKVTPTEKTENMYKVKINQRSSAKLKYGTQQVGIDYCQQRIKQYIDKATQKGIVIPSLPFILE
ncbi:hypothetical protein [Chroococcus sp. FPU101]|uniref:hypothetical protein n=1 Tax=Chroococcus sp. FPU101 TaxID=1974212 RepID=UPI001A90669A|nr:hypothetical protein [Chroococcus sp. FPU101]GFE71052.1 hypothetical protein CFPU101_36620 [Chroococcus sp. FPU101]